MTAYFHGCGRTPKCKVLAITRDGKRVQIQELNRGNPMELRGADPRPYWTDERHMYAKCKTEGGRFKLEGKPDYTGVPVEDEA